MSRNIEFEDLAGVHWTVSEEGRDDLLADAAEAYVTWLSFESEREIRRLWSYPDDWRRLSRWQLDALCRRASTVVARFPRRGDGCAKPQDAEARPER